jgi:hypothetical protein
MKKEIELIGSTIFLKKRTHWAIYAVASYEGDMLYHNIRKQGELVYIETESLWYFRKAVYIRYIHPNCLKDVVTKLKELNK